MCIFRLFSFLSLSQIHYNELSYIMNKGLQHVCCNLAYKNENDGKLAKVITCLISGVTRKEGQQ